MPECFRCRHELAVLEPYGEIMARIRYIDSDNKVQDVADKHRVVIVCASCEPILKAALALVFADLGSPVPRHQDRGAE